GAEGGGPRRGAGGTTSCIIWEEKRGASLRTRGFFSGADVARGRSPAHEHERPTHSRCTCNKHRLSRAQRGRGWVRGRRYQVRFCDEGNICRDRRFVLASTLRHGSLTHSLPFATGQAR